MWHLDRFIGGCLICGLLLRAFPDPVDVPGRQGGVEWVLYPVVPLILASLLPQSLVRCRENMELLSGRFGVVGRTFMAVGVAVSLIATTTVVTGVWLWQNVRNAAAAVGLACLCVMLPAAVRWVPPVLLAIVVWLVGVPSPGLEPPEWAMVLSASTSVVSAVVCTGVAAVGIGVFVARQ